MTHTTSNKAQIVVVFKLQRGDETTTRSLTFDNGISSATDVQMERTLAQLNFVFLSDNTLQKSYTAGTGTAEGTWADYTSDTSIQPLMTVKWNQVVQYSAFEDAGGVNEDDENPWTCVGVTLERRFATTHYYTQTE